MTWPPTHTRLPLRSQPPSPAQAVRSHEAPECLPIRRFRRAVQQRAVVVHDNLLARRIHGPEDALLGDGIVHLQGDAEAWGAQAVAYSRNVREDILSNKGAGGREAKHDSIGVPALVLMPTMAARRTDYVGPAPAADPVAQLQQPRDEGMT